MLRYRSNEDVKLIIDDNDTSVTYSADWRADATTATYLQAYDSTMHYTVQPNVNASISFYGSYITLFGIIPSILDLKMFTTAGSQVQSSYQLDDGPTEFFDATLEASKHFTNQAFFQPNTTQSDGHHTLVITNLAGMFLLDYFTIVPANSGSSSYIQKIDDASPNITYNNAKPLSNTSQADFDSTLHNLPSPQSTASLKFNGNFVAVYGALPAGNSLPNVSFTLDSVDQPVPTGQSDPSGSIPGLSAYRKQRLSQVLFWKSSILNDGQHNLFITTKQGEFLLDFILIQTSDSVGTRSTVPSQSLTQTKTYVTPSSSTNAPPYGSATAATSSGSASSGAPSDHTKNTSAIVERVVGGAVGFVVLLLAVYMIRILFKRRSSLRSKTQANTESSSQPPVQARLTVTTIATAGKPYLIDGSDPHVTGYIPRPSMGSVPPPRRSNSASLSPSPQDLTRLSLPTNSQRMSGNTVACCRDNSCLPVRQSMLDTHRSSLPPSLPPANRSSIGHGPYGRTLVTQRPPLPPSPPPTYRSSTGHNAHQGYEHTLDMQRSSLPPSLPPTYRSSTGHGPHQGYEHTIDSLRSSAPSLPPTYRPSTGHDAHQGYEPYEGIVKD